MVPVRRIVRAKTPRTTRAVFCAVKVCAAAFGRDRRNHAAATPSITTERETTTIKTVRLDSFRPGIGVKTRLDLVEGSGLCAGDMAIGTTEALLYTNSGR